MEWCRCEWCFNDYLLAIGLIETTTVAVKGKLALFRQVGGEDVRERYSQMEFVGDDGDGNPGKMEKGAAKRTLEVALGRFYAYCNPRSGVIVTHYKFHKSSQNGEYVEVRTTCRELRFWEAERFLGQP